MTGRLKDKIALITGASRGIGESIAVAYAREGARLVICSRKLEGVEQAASRIKAAVPEAAILPLACHTGRVEDIAAMVERAVAEVGHPDVLVNNAATNPHFGPMLSVDAGAWEKTFEVNVRGYFECIRQVATRNIAAGRPLSVINVASILGMRGAPLQGVYGMTKAAVLSMTATLAVELGQQGVRVNAIAPGLVDTRFAAILINTPEITKIFTERTALKRYAQPDEIAGIATFLASDESSYVTGQTFAVDGGYTVA